MPFQAAVYACRILRDNAAGLPVSQLANASMSGFRCFYPAVVTIGLLPWIVGGLLFGKTGLMIGLVTSFLGIMLLNDANKQRVQEQRLRMRRSVKRKRQD